MTALARCPACDREGTLIRFEPVSDVNHNTANILQCRNCLVLLNGRAHDLLGRAEIEAIQLTDYYLADSLRREEAQEMLRQKGGILDYLYAKIDRPFSQMTFCDFGGGAGLVAMAASNRFAQTYICEFDTRSVEQMCAVLGKPANMEIVRSLAEIHRPIDVMFMWHVLEHIPNPLEFLRSLRPHLARDCVFFVQCPGYRPAAVVDCHYTFFNEPSMRQLFQTFGVAEIEIGFDIQNGFVGFIGQLS